MWWEDMGHDKVGRIEFGPNRLEPLGIMPRQSDTRLGVDNHMLRKRVADLKAILEKVITSCQGPGTHGTSMTVPAEVIDEVKTALQAASASEILDSLPR